MLALLALLGALAGVAGASAVDRVPDAGRPRAATTVPPATPSPRATYIAPAGPTLPPARQDPAVARRPPNVRGLIVPIAGARIPTDPILLPDAPRTYRSGIHEGIDFAAPLGTPVVAAAGGVIVRIDHAYTEQPAAVVAAALAEANRLGYTPGKTLDMLRGRQVWIDHGGGIVTRYCHLSSVAPFPVGAYVRAGEVIGKVGSSGLPENGPHLHFEIRVGDDFLGDGLHGAALERVIDLAFR